VRLSGALQLRATKGENYYTELISRKEETAALEVIHRDLHRTFPDHVQVLIFIYFSEFFVFFVFLLFILFYLFIYLFL
jgi:hypothetical protein